MASAGSNNAQSSDVDFLDLPSLYHAEPSPHPHSPIVRPGTSISSCLPSFFSRSKYRPVTDAQSNDEADEPDTETQSYKDSRVRWADAVSTPHPSRRAIVLSHGTNWTLLLALALLLSLTLNAFFLAYLGGERRYATIPHDAFAVTELGRNYTCYHEQATQLHRVDRFERVGAAYDRYWRELLGGSDGYVYTQDSGTGSGVRQARFGMFHQLECLYQIRRALRAREGKSKWGDFVVVGEEGE